MIEYETRYWLVLPTAPGVWTVGRINVHGDWFSESNHTNRKEADERRDLLNRMEQATLRANPQLIEEV